MLIGPCQALEITARAALAASLNDFGCLSSAQLLTVVAPFVKSSCCEICSNMGLLSTLEVASWLLIPSHIASSQTYRQNYRIRFSPISDLFLFSSVRLITFPNSHYPAFIYHKAVINQPKEPGLVPLWF